MKRTFFLGIFLFFATSAYTQKYFDCYLGVNHPLKYSSSKPLRKTGLEIGFGIGKHLNSKFSIETNISFTGWLRSNYKFGYFEIVSIDNVEYPIFIVDKSTRLSTDISTNFLIGYEVNKINVKNGFALTYKNLIQHESNSLIDPEEVDLTNQNLYLYDYRKVLGIEYCLKITYLYNNMIIPYLEFKTVLFSNYNSNTNNKYGIISAGLIVKFARR